MTAWRFVHARTSSSVEVIGITQSTDDAPVRAQARLILDRKFSRDTSTSKVRMGEPEPFAIHIIEVPVLTGLQEIPP